MNFSVFTAISEIFVTIFVLYILIGNLKGKEFSFKLWISVVLFEFFVNMLYMVYRLDNPKVGSDISSGMALLYALHGSLSLLVFIGFVVLGVFIYKDSKRRVFFAQHHKKIIYTFIFFWMVSVLSGEVIFVINHLL